MNPLMPHPQLATEKKSTPITAVIAGLAPAVISSQGAGRSLISKAVGFSDLPVQRLEGGQF